MIYKQRVTRVRTNKYETIIFFKNETRSGEYEKQPISTILLKPSTNIVP